jgi:hypothetical protein|tara:strand:+ start:288 stop:1178 length:891 start_codon:yes stop_codon:yes gene_type:complete
MSKTIQTKKGLVLKPDGVSNLGNVTFTDGTLTGLFADQKTCEAYGYKYNLATGTCSAFTTNFNIVGSVTERNKINLGTNNEIPANTQNNFVIGTNNLQDGFNNNTFILGNEHEIEAKIKNASILGGSRATVNRQSEVAIGGGQRAISDSTNAVTFNSKRKTSTLELSCVTIDNTATNMTIQGDGESFINVENNSIIGYDIYITRLELGGTSGTAGNYSYRNIRGAVKINQVGVMSFVVGFSRNIAKVGVNGTCIMADSTTGGVPSISVNVQDRNNVQNLWSASVTLHEVISETNIV